MSPEDSTDCESTLDPTMHPNLARGLAVERALARLPVYSDSTIRTSAQSGVSTVRAFLSSRSTELGAMRHLEQTVVVGPGLQPEVVYTGPLAPMNLTTTSPDGHLTVHFRAIGKGKDQQRVIEIIQSSSGVVAELNVTKDHSEVLSGETWGKPSWHPELELLVYIAEQHSPGWDAADKPFSAYEYCPNAGEELHEMSRPALFVLDLRDLYSVRVRQITTVEGDTCTLYAQPVFAPTLDTETLVIYATGRSLLRSGQKLGLVWCYNRPTAIYRLTASLGTSDGICAVRISERGRSARSPRIIAEQSGTTYLFYLTNRTEFEHGGCSALHRVQLVDGKVDTPETIKVLVESVWEPVTRESFPGLFVFELPDKPFLAVRDSEGKEATFVCMTSMWRSQERLVTVRVHDGRVESHYADQSQNLGVFGTDGGSRVVGLTSGPTALPQLCIGEAELSNGVLRFHWQAVKKWQPSLERSVIDGLPRIQSSMIRLPNDPATEIVLLTSIPVDSKDTICGSHQSDIFGAGREIRGIPPLLFDIHGGPNDADSTAFSRTAFSWAAAGFSVALVNYPGSTGLGQKRIQALSGDAGRLELDAIRAAHIHLVKLGIASMDPGKQHFAGGSYSGFMGAHLSARWPEMFASVCLRNPVTDLASCFATSDIPDWTLAHFGARYAFDNPPAFVPEEDQARLWAMSPSSRLVERLAKSNAPCMPPTLVQLGSADLRIPPNQGLAWYHALKGHGEEVQMLWYPGSGHLLESDQPKPFEAALSFAVAHAQF